MIKILLSVVLLFTVVVADPPCNGVRTLGGLYQYEIELPSVYVIGVKKQRGVKLRMTIPTQNRFAEVGATRVRVNVHPRRGFVSVHYHLPCDLMLSESHRDK